MELRTAIHKIKFDFLTYSQYTQTEYFYGVTETFTTEFSSYAAF